MRKKKGQIKVQQMSFMIIALAIFFVLVGLFALNFILSGIKDSKSELEDERATLLAQRIADSSEFSCANAFGGTKSNCIDMDKALQLKDKMEEYKEFWGVEGIEIFRLYPAENLNVECNSVNYPYCSHLTLLEPKSLGTDKSSYVSLCRKEKSPNSNLFYDKCEIGEIVVRVLEED